MWNNVALAGLRIYLGLIFALAVYPKLTMGASFAGALNVFLMHVLYRMRILSTSIS